MFMAEAPTQLGEPKPRKYLAQMSIHNPNITKPSDPQYIDVRVYPPSEHSQDSRRIVVKDRKGREITLEPEDQLKVEMQILGTASPETLERLEAKKHPSTRFQK